MRVAIYAPVSTANSGQDPRVQLASSVNTASVGLGSLLVSMWMSGSPARGKNGPELDRPVRCSNPEHNSSESHRSSVSFYFC